MTPRQQRFCPLCERAFADGEAVLRCDGCGVMHHPACWVKNGGCATSTEHKSSPVALGYSAERPGSNASPHPGEGTRVVSAPETPAAATVQRPIELRPGRRAAAEEPPPDEEAEDEAAVIGAEPVPAHHTLPFPPSLTGEAVRKRPSPSAAYKADHTGKPMPRVYGRHRILQFWYVPAAILLAAGVALGVIWVAGQFDGDGSSDAAADLPTTTVSTPTPPATVSAGGASTPGATVSATPGVTGKFQPNDVVVVTGAGPGSGSEAGCLNVRTEPGTNNPAIVCVPDGTQLTVLGGPQEAGGLQWWKVKLASGDGWAAEDYLAKR